MIRSLLVRIRLWMRRLLRKPNQNMSSNPKSNNQNNNPGVKVSAPIEVKKEDSFFNILTRAFQGTQTFFFLSLVFSGMHYVYEMISKYEIMLWLKGFIALLILCFLFSDWILIAFTKVLSLLGLAIEIRKN